MVSIIAVGSSYLGYFVGSELMEWTLAYPALLDLPIFVADGLEYVV